MYTAQAGLIMLAFRDLSLITVTEVWGRGGLQNGVIVDPKDRVKPFTPPF